MRTVDALYAALLAKSQQPSTVYGSVQPLQESTVSQTTIQQHLTQLEQARLLANLQALVLQQQQAAAAQQKQQALNAASTARMTPSHPTQPNNPTAAKRIPTPPPPPPPQSPAPSWTIRAGQPAPPAPPAPRTMSPNAPTFVPNREAAASRFWGASPSTSPPAAKQRNGIPPPPPRQFMYTNKAPALSPPSSVSSRASCDIIDQLPDEWEY